jgi:hypothetical protein
LLRPAVAAAELHAGAVHLLLRLMDLQAVAHRAQHEGRTRRTRRAGLLGISQWLSKGHGCTDQRQPCSNDDATPEATQQSRWA